MSYSFLHVSCIIHAWFLNTSGSYEEQLVNLHISLRDSVIFGQFHFIHIADAAIQHDSKGRQGMKNMVWLKDGSGHGKCSLEENKSLLESVRSLKHKCRVVSHEERWLVR